ncbi:hypothetical protein BH11PSE11_BH11PSE11_34230 [soil metagenome]
MGNATEVTSVAAGNRRQYLRVMPDADAPVRVDINGADFIEVIEAVDISEDGIGITVTHQFAGCDVNRPASFIVYLPMPINRYFRVEGRIMHVRGDSFGVRFTNLNDKSRELLREYIAMWLRKRSAWDYIRYMLHMLR